MRIPTKVSITWCHVCCIHAPRILGHVKDGLQPSTDIQPTDRYLCSIVGQEKPNLLQTAPTMIRDPPEMTQKKYKYTLQSEIGITFLLELFF